MNAGHNFEQIVRDHQAMVFRTLLRLTGNREYVEDLAQEVFLRLYRALPAFRGDSMLTTYLYRIIVNVAQDEWKRRRREDRPVVSMAEDERSWEDRLPHPGLNAEQHLSEQQFRQSLEVHLQQLNAVERTVLVLYHQEERSYEQIATALELPIGTVRTHLHRGRKKLREAIQKQQVEEQQRHGARRTTACTTAL